MVVSFTEEQVLRLCQVEHKFHVEPVKFLGQGTYNQGWEVIAKKNPKPLVLRMSREPGDLADLRAELKLYQTFRRLRIGIPMKKGIVIPVGSSQGILAILSEKGTGTLHDYLAKRVNTQVSVNNMAWDTIQAIRETVQSGYFCADVKPENMLVTDTKVYMADFDPFFCQTNEWLKRLCKTKGISTKCRLHRKSVETFRDLLTRVLIFQLVTIVGNTGYNNPRATEFARYVYKYGIENAKQIGRKAIVVGDSVISPEEVLEHLLDESLKYTTMVLDHYSGVGNTVHSQAFQNALSNFYTVQGISPKPKRKNSKRKLGEDCTKGSQCYTKTCTQGKCVRKT